MSAPRVATLLPSATEIVCALGARESLVGRSHECDHPAGVESVPVLTSSRVSLAGSCAQIDQDVRESGPSPSVALARGERRGRLKKAMRSLSADHRTVLELSRMERLPIKTIAERMGRSESAIKNLLLRATRQLRRSFGDTDSFNLDVGRIPDGGSSDGG